MSKQYELGRSETLPETSYRRRSQWRFIWDAMTEAFDEGYTGWVTAKLPNEKEINSACQSLYHYRRGKLRDGQALEFYKRKQADSSYILFVRLSRTEEAIDAPVS